MMQDYSILSHLYFPFTVKQMSFQILAPFEHFLQVSTLFWSTFDKIHYSLFNNNLSFTHFRVALQAATTSFRCSMYCCVSSIFLLCSNIAFTFTIFLLFVTFPRYFHLHLYLLHLLPYDLKLTS